MAQVVSLAASCILSAALLAVPTECAVSLALTVPTPLSAWVGVLSVSMRSAASVALVASVGAWRATLSAQALTVAVLATRSSLDEEGLCLRVKEVKLAVEVAGEGLGEEATLGGSG